MPKFNVYPDLEAADVTNASAVTMVVRDAQSTPTTKEMSLNAVKKLTSNYFNVKDYGAVGDAKQVTDAVVTPGSTTVTSATANFTAADVGKIVFAGHTASSTAVPLGTITARNSATSITVSVAATQNLSSCHLVWGSADDSNAMEAAFLAAKAAMPLKGVVYIPPGGYIVSKCVFNNTYPSFQQGVSVVGAGSGHTVIYPSPNFTYLAGSNMGMVFHCEPYTTASVTFAGFHINGSMQSFSSSHWAMAVSCIGLGGIEDVRVNDFIEDIAGGVKVSSSFDFHISNVFCQYISPDGIGVAMRLDYVYGDIVNLVTSNSKVGLSVNNSPGLSAEETNRQLNLFGCHFDECSVFSVWINSCTDLNFYGCKAWAVGGNGIAVYVSTSGTDVKFTDCIIEPFINATNGKAISIDDGCTVRLQGCEIKGEGTGYAINNSGTVLIGTGTTLTGPLVGNTPKVHIGLPAEAAGDILVRDATGWVRLPKGGNGSVLTMVSGAPAWV